MFIPLGHETSEYDHETLDELAQTLVDSGRVTSAIEVGSWAGSTALTLVPHFDTLYCVDTFEGNPGTHLEENAEIMNEDGIEGVFRVFCHNMGAKLLYSIIPCVGKSTEWAAIWPFPVDLIFIDADHEYENVLADIKAWRPHVRAGGILCGHDYDDQFPGVVQAVEEEFKEFNSKGNVWWVKL